MIQTFPVLIVGGGPAGATLAALLSKAGVSVAVLERATFPRYHIGESLIPQVLDTLELSGALHAVERAGFLRKEGGLFRWGASKEPWVVYFDELAAHYGRTYAYQVERSKFDAILLDNARRCGATVLEGWRALDLSRDGTTNVVTALTEKGPVTLRAELVVDCTGQAAWLGRKHRMRRFDRVLSNIAMASYFEGATRLRGRDGNSIFCEALPTGWLWFIPLDEQLSSVGFVTRASDKHRGFDGQKWLDAAINQTCHVKKLLGGARQREPVRLFADFSYQCTRLVAPGIMLVGDAGGFLDPIWSTGVFLATEGARHAAQGILNWTRNGDEAELYAYERRMREILAAYREFIAYFYKAHVEPRAYFWKAFEIVDSAVDERDALIRLVSGRLSMQPRGESKPQGKAGRVAS